MATEAGIQDTRPPSARVALEAPRRWRAFVRARETSLVVLAAGIGAAAGLAVTLMSAMVGLLHAAFFGLAPHERLSASMSVDPVRAIAVPLLGGLAFGIALRLLAKWRPGREIDPIEANALHGGRMSLRGSLVVALQTVWSSGVGASVGLEAGYTQIASGIASWLGRAFRVRRNDQRLLIGCGAAGAIAGAFGAPLAGAFYGFELIIGGYTIASLAPVGLAALVGYLVSRAFAPFPLGVVAESMGNVTTRDLAIASLMGLVAAPLGITLMRGVALCETLLTRVRIAPVLRPALGGLIVGLFALVTPQVMSSGHGALYLDSMIQRPLAVIAMIFVLKSLASIVSLGSGFRGGMFFASLLLGTLYGRLFAAGVSMIWPDLGPDPNVYAIIGMGALSVSVIGGPLTMTFIALESTGNFWLMTAVLIAVIISAQITREAFGYSFATWRFHLRGETIRSAADVGWIRDLTVGRLMRHDVPTVPIDMPIEEFRRNFPLGSSSQMIAVDRDGRYAGMIIVPEAHGAETNGEVHSLSDIAHHQAVALLPHMTVQEAATAFDRAEAESLAVVDSPLTRRVIGLLSEAHALRRYAEESERRRRELLGET